MGRSAVALLRKTTLLCWGLGMGCGESPAEDAHDSTEASSTETLSPSEATSEHAATDASGDADRDADGDGTAASTSSTGPDPSDDDGEETSQATDTTGDDPIPTALFVLRIQPIQVALDDGSSPANEDERLFEEVMDKVWAQGDIDIEYLPWVTWNSTRAWDAPLLSDDIDWAAQNAPLHDDPSVTNMIFIDSINGRGGIGGLSLTPGRIMFISDWALDATLHVLPHELGHNLGLDHTTFGAEGDPQNLMSARLPGGIDDIYPDGGQYLQLNAQQLEHALMSDLVVPVQ